MYYLINVGKVLVLTSFLGLLVACGDHGHEDSTEEKKDHGHSHSQN
ncbi:hypothetical protein SAMN05421760_113111 [Neptunomonas antarctica]|uniref:Uncharacterized protein n=1 Tax=Neptunomonas antarctica TaxID=619304 RepID=A0A1N7PB80_9GAMM|nr:hypothetical protein SAMN05421760_113111 [Neptunomonas antarctica]